MTAEFTQKLTRRRESYWVLLAAAAGDDQALDETTAGITAQVLERGVGGAAVAPSIVRQRVDAVAAFDPRLLADLVRDWRPPREIAKEPFWLAAWTTALRHLDRAKFPTGDIRAAELASEAELTWGAPMPEPISWRELKSRLMTGYVSYEELRRGARQPLVEERIDADSLSDTPKVMLRLLRGRTDLLDASARSVVADWAGKLTDGDPFDSAAVAEIAREAGVLAIDAMRRRLVELLPRVSDARDVLPLAYVLIDHGWVIP